MKGSLHTDELMRAVTASATGLRTDRRISHVFIMDVPGHPETLFITDAAINIFPDLDVKRDIVQNARRAAVTTPRAVIGATCRAATRPSIPWRPARAVFRGPTRGGSQTRREAVSYEIGSNCRARQDAVACGHRRC